MVLIAIPGAMSLVSSESTRAFIEQIESRPVRDAPKLDSVSDLIDSAYWSEISGSIEDRMALRANAARIRPILRRDVFNPEWLGVSRNKDVLAGADNWLFYTPSLGSGYTTIEETESTLAQIDMWFETHSEDREVVLFVVPDKATIYPELLGEAARELYESKLDQRELIHRWVAREEDPIPDVITPMRASADSSPDPIYEPAGSHFNGLGAMVLTEMMIEWAQPGAWDPSFVTRTWEEKRVPELARLAWIWDRQDNFYGVEVVRPGITRTLTHVAGETIEGEQTRDAIAKTQGQPARFVSEGDGLIPGRTLIIHDSFVGLYMRPSLSRYFEDVSFVHIDRITPEGLVGALDVYDRVIIECVERLFVGRARRLFVENAPPDLEQIPDLVDRGE